VTTMTTPDLERKPNSFGPFAYLGILVGVALSVAKALVWSSGSFDAEVSGYAIGAIATALLVAYLIGGRKKVRNPNLFSLSFCGICLLLYLMERSTPHVNWKKHMGEIAKQAAGTKATSDEPSGDPQTDAIARTCFVTCWIGGNRMMQR
jgi:hypothetical protein